jgi:RNA polymerase sigma factor (sigma-70 family)
MNVIASAPASTKDLVRAAIDGDLSAQEQLVRRYHTVVWRTVRRFRLREADAQDAVQNTWLQMIQHLGSLRSAERLPGWLATTARREALKIARQHGRDVVGLEPEVADRAADGSPGPEHVAVDGAMSRLLWRHVAELPPRGRDMLAVLSASDAPRYAEFASLTGMPVGSIGPMRMRYLGTLRRQLEDAGLGVRAWY